MQKRVDRYRPKQHHFIKRAKTISLSAVTLIAPVLGAVPVNAQDTVWHANSVENIRESISTNFDNETNRYTVQWGDTVNTIAEAFNINANTLIKDNNISNANLIYAGEELTITSDRSGYVAADSVVANIMATHVPAANLQQQIDNTPTGLSQVLNVLQATPTEQQAKTLKQEAQEQGLVANDQPADPSVSAKSAELPTVAPETSENDVTATEATETSKPATGVTSDTTTPETSQAPEQEPIVSELPIEDTNNAIAPTNNGDVNQDNAQQVPSTPVQGTNEEIAEQVPAQVPVQSEVAQTPTQQPQAPVQELTVSESPVEDTNNATAPTNNGDVNQDNAQQIPSTPVQGTNEEVVEQVPAQPQVPVQSEAPAPAPTPAPTPVTQGVDVDKTVQWFYNREGKLTYSMYGSRNGTDGTADCSGAVTQAIYDAGGTKPAYLYNTDTLHGYLKQNGYRLISDNQDWNAKKGDVVIWGKQGYSGGSAGHVSIISTDDPNAKAVSVNYVTHGKPNTAVTEEDYNQFAQSNNYPYTYAYRHASVQ